MFLTFLEIDVSIWQFQIFLLTDAATGRVNVWNTLTVREQFSQRRDGEGVLLVARKECFVDVVIPALESRSLLKLNSFEERANDLAVGSVNQTRLCTTLELGLPLCHVAMLVLLLALGTLSIPEVTVFDWNNQFMNRFDDILRRSGL